MEGEGAAALRRGELGRGGSALKYPSSQTAAWGSPSLTCPSHQQQRAMSAPRDLSALAVLSLVSRVDYRASRVQGAGSRGPRESPLGSTGAEQSSDGGSFAEGTSIGLGGGGLCQGRAAA